MHKTLWLSIIIKNEKENIIKNLLNFHNSFFDIIVVDTWSTDWAIELLKENRIKIISYNLDKNDKFSLIKARNYSISLNNADYILVLDADEFISLENINKIKSSINKKNNTDWYFIKFLDYRYREPFEDYKLCLFKKNIFFEWYVHANPQSFFRKQNFKAIFLKNIEIHHRTNSFSQEKIERYISQLQYWIKKEKNNTRYLWFLWYSFYKFNKINNAKKYLELSLNTFSDFYPVETINAWMILSYIYHSEENISKSLDTINLTINFYEKVKNDFEVKINFRMEETIYKIKENLLKNKEINFLYEFMY